jgi:hypothetical protein
MKLSLATILLLFATANSAQAITVTSYASAIYNPVLWIDGDTGTTSLNISGFGLSSIGKVNVTVRLTKCDDPIDASGGCIGLGNSFNGEISLQLTSPKGTTVNLISPYTFTGQTPGRRAQFTFDDDALTTIGGNELISGIYRPVEPLSRFNGENGNGDWILTYGDSRSGDPLSVNAFSIKVAAVPWQTDALPLTGSTLLFGLGLWAKGKGKLSRRKLTPKSTLIDVR